MMREVDTFAVVLRPMLHAAMALPNYDGQEGLGYVMMGALIDLAHLVQRECPRGSWQHDAARQVLEDIAQQPEAP